MADLISTNSEFTHRQVARIWQITDNVKNLNLAGHMQKLSHALA